MSSVAVPPRACISSSTSSSAPAGAPDQDQVRALAGEGAGDRAADAAGGAGDQRKTAGETFLLFHGLTVSLARCMLQGRSIRARVSAWLETNALDLVPAVKRRTRRAPQFFFAGSDLDLSIRSLAAFMASS